MEEAQIKHQLWDFDNATQMYYSLKKVLNTVSENLKEDYSYGVVFSYLCEYTRKNNISLSDQHMTEIANQLYQTTNWEFFDDKENKMISSHSKKRKSIR